MFITLVQYIDSLKALNDAGKDKKIQELLQYYNRYNQNLKTETGTFYAVIYARYSSHGQREESIEGQVREALEYAARNSLIVMGVYVDKAMTGKNDDRDNFRQMIKDAAKRKYQYVICWKLDRFARNRYDSARYKAKLKEYNVRVVSARESIPEGPEGILLESVLEGQAEYYSASLRENVNRGMTDNALECKYNGGTVPLGYVIQDQRYIPNPETAPIVNRIFNMYNSDFTIREITGFLNAQGIKSSRGAAFNKNSLHTLLRNEKYIGVYKFGNIREENGIPAIIKKELFNAVQNKLNKNKKNCARKKGLEEYLLTTKLYCGKCSMGMVGTSGVGRHGGVYRYYACIGHTRDKKCDKSPVQKDWIENLVIDETVQLVLCDDMIQQIADGVIAYQEKETDNSMLDGLKRELRAKNKAIENIINAIEQGIITPSTKKRLETLEDEKSRIETGIMQESMSSPKVEREQIIFFLERFRGGDVTDIEYRKHLIDVFVNSVYVYDDKIIITYNYSGDNNKITLEEISEALEKMDDIEGTTGVSIDTPMAHQHNITQNPFTL